jgi:hypothetical protein
MGPIPGEEYPPIQQAAVILKASQHKAVANQFMAFLKKPEIVALLEKYGFAVPKNQLRSGVAKFVKIGLRTPVRDRTPVVIDTLDART